MVLQRVLRSPNIRKCSNQLSRFKSSTTTVEAPMPEHNHTAAEYSGPLYEDVVKIRKDRLSPTLTTHFKKPLLIHHGNMQWLFDHTGRRYLDMFAGIVTVSVGHCHPKVNKALEDQVKTLWHTTNIYMHPKIHEYAVRLTEKMPGDLKTVYFVNSGSEANDLAMLIARLYTGNYEILSFRNAYHGMSYSTMGLTAHSTWRYPVPAVNCGIHHVMNPDPYLGIWGGSHCRDSPVQPSRHCSCEFECQAGNEYYKQLEQVFKFSLPRGKVAAMFAESIQGVGGTVQYPKGYLEQAAQLVRANGGLFISDEVQTGFGRTGDTFWGFESQGIVPDIVTMAKGIGNGFPLGAVITTSKIAECLTQALHFNTYGGNPMASAVGIAVLDVIEEEQLQKNCRDVGTFFLERLAELRDRHEIIGDVRGKGLMIGVELVQNKETKEPLSALHVANIWETCKDLGVLFGRGGINGNVLRISPPMCVTKTDVEYVLSQLENILDQHKSKKIRSCNRNSPKSTNSR